MTLAEAARMAGMDSGSFRRYVRSGASDASLRGGRVVMSDEEAYRLVTRNVPNRTMGRSRLMTCGRHSFIVVSAVSCPACGRALREAGVTEAAMVRDGVRRCARCGAEAKIARGCRNCETCRALRSERDGAKSQVTWDRKSNEHSCCGSKAHWRHRLGCVNSE